MKIKEAASFKDSVVSLLTVAKLPVADLPETLEHFLVALQDNVAVAVIGLEIYADYGLLRSLAVSPGFRKLGLARRLVQRIESLAASKGLSAIYLLTETAPMYFEQKGYAKISRDEVPAEVQLSSEFSHVCPQSAIVMKKELNHS